MFRGYRPGHMTPTAHLAEHHRAGVYRESGGLRTFALDMGTGPTVVLVHGVPASSFAYRKVASLLAEAGLRVVAFDLPGLGFTERPTEFDYTWTGLGAWLRGAIAGLGIERYHLVVHDLGGPVGFEAMADEPSRVLSLTLLNTMVAVDGFEKPWVMRPFEVGTLDRAWLAMMRPFAFIRLMRLNGVADPGVSDDELLAYLEQLRWADGGRAFLRIMKGFEPTTAKQERFTAAVRAVERRQIVWGVLDPALRYDTIGRASARAAAIGDVHLLQAKHFVQEERASEVTGLILDLTR